MRSKIVLILFLLCLFFCFELSAKECELTFQRDKWQDKRIGVIGAYATEGDFLNYLDYDYSYLDKESYFSSILDEYSVLIVPAGLPSKVDLEKVKTELELYVGRGGIILLLAQMYGEDYKIVPGELSGIGYAEAQSAPKKSCEVVTEGHSLFSIFSSQKKKTLDIHIDGYFTKYPDNAQILLRATSTSMPTMLIYKYGKGYVIATSFYSPYAYKNKELNLDEELLFKNILDWAKYKVLNCPVVNLGDTIKAEIPAIKEISQMITSMRLTEVWLDKGFLEEWMTEEEKKEWEKQREKEKEEWEKERFPEIRLEAVLVNPKKEIVDSQEKNLNLWENSGMKETYVYDNPLKEIGLWGIKYKLLDSKGEVFDEGETNFYVISKEEVIEKTPSSPLGFSINTVSDRLFFGEDILFAVNLYNRSDIDTEVIVKYWDDNKGGKPGWVTWYGANAVKKVKVPKFGESGFFYIHRELKELKGSAFDAYFYDATGKEIGYLIKGIQPSPRDKTIKIKIDMDKEVYKIGDTVKAKIILDNLKSDKRMIGLIIQVLDPQKNSIFEKSVQQFLAPSQTSKEYLVDFPFMPIDSQHDSVIIVKAEEEGSFEGMGCEYICSTH